jgi:hypothetical protein
MGGKSYTCPIFKLTKRSGLLRKCMATQRLPEVERMVSGWL